MRTGEAGDLSVQRWDMPVRPQREGWGVEYQDCGGKRLKKGRRKCRRRGDSHGGVTAGS